MALEWVMESRDFMEHYATGKIDGKEVNGTRIFPKGMCSSTISSLVLGYAPFRRRFVHRLVRCLISPTISSKDSRQWKRRDFTHYPLSMGGLFHDVEVKEPKNSAK